MVYGEEGVSSDKDEKKAPPVTVEFDLGEIITYDNERMHDFHNKWFGWYPEFLIFLGLDMPSGIQDMSLTLSQLYSNGFKNSFRFRWGGGVEFIVYQGGPDGRDIRYLEEFSRSGNFWTEQDERRRAGLTYVETGYDRAFADWGFDWLGNYSVEGKSGRSEVEVMLGYSGRWGQFLKDYKAETIQYLFETDYPDRNMYLINKLTASIEYTLRRDFKERFNHELYNEVGTRFVVDIAPSAFNPSITGEYQPLKTPDGHFVLDSEGKKVYSDEKAYTADYYRLFLEVFGRKKLFDVAPRRKSTLFTGHLLWGGSFRYTDYLGDEGYIPLDARMEIRDDVLYGRRDDVFAIREYTRSVALTSYIELVLGLPQVKIEDLKNWSPTKVNADWGKFENFVGRLLKKTGVEPDVDRWNQTNLIDPTLSFKLGTNWIKQLGENPGNRYQTFFIDKPSWMDVDFIIDLNVRVFDILNLGLIFEFELEYPQFNEMWFRFGG